MIFFSFFLSFFPFFAKDGEWFFSLDDALLVDFSSAHIARMGCLIALETDYAWIASKKTSIPEEGRKIESISTFICLLQSKKNYFLLLEKAKKSFSFPLFPISFFPCQFESLMLWVAQSVGCHCQGVFFAFPSLCFYYPPFGRTDERASLKIVLDRLFCFVSLAALSSAVASRPIVLEKKGSKGRLARRDAKWGQCFKREGEKKLPH